MSAPLTLSNEQWASLHALFDRAIAADAAERAAIVAQARLRDPVLACTLEAMLGAHERMQGRTGEQLVGIEQQASRARLLPDGAMLGPYRIAGLVGEGGMGLVYRAERVDGEVALTVAIKLLRPRALDTAARERFRRERDLLAGLNHPHIARLFDAGVDTIGQPYFVMEYVSGMILSRWCDERRLAVRARLRMFLDVCEAVRYAHGQLVLHRDIKPGNVLVDASGVAKLIDFGIAKPIAPDTEEAARTATAQRCFSLGNVAPEQLLGGRMGVACDVYQLGALLYELLCGQTVFDLADMTMRQIEDAILRQPPVAPSARARSGERSVAQARGCADPQSLSRQLAGDLDEIALMALRKEPDRRYASVERLMEDVQRHLDLQPVRARGSQRAYRARLFVKRHWRGLGLAAVAALSVAAFVAALAIESRQLQRERDRAEQATQFLVGVFKAADPKLSLNRSTPIGEVLENGSRKLDGQLSGSPELVADLSYALASIYADIDDFSRARTYATRALRLRQQADPGSARVAASFAQLAIVEEAAGDCKGTMADGSRALALYRDLKVGVSGSVELQARMIRCEGHAQGAVHAAERMNALLEALQRDPAATIPQVAGQEAATAEVWAQVARNDAALRLRRSAVARLEHSPWNHSAEALQARLDLASSLSDDGQFAPADAMFGPLLRDEERIYGHASLAFANALQLRASNYFGWGRLREAEADDLEVLRIRTLSRPGLHYDVADVEYDLGEIYSKGYKDAARAGPYYEEAVRVSEATAGPNDLLTLTSKLERGIWLERAGRLNEAEAMLQPVLPGLPAGCTCGIRARLALAAIHQRDGQKVAADALLTDAEAGISREPHFAFLKGDAERVRGGGMY